MRIDRTRFFLLAGAMATATAGGCFVQSADDDDGEGGSGGTPTSTQTDGGGGSSDGGMGGDTGTGGNGGDGGSGGTCDDSVGDTVDCSGVINACSTFAIEACDASTAAFKPAVAEAAANCIVNLDAAAGCLEVYECRKDALNDACPDASADALCATLIDTCNTAGNPTTEVECHSYVDGLNEFGRTSVETCDCAFGIYSCIEGVGF